LGAGGFGLTYWGWDTVLDKPVAVKEYLPNDLAVRAADNSVAAKSGGDEDNFRWGLNRFLDEARTLAKFKHPNIVSVYRYFEAHGTAYIVMEFIEGETFGAYLKRVGKPKEAFLHDVITALLDGLAEVHRAGFMHRDIKPGNIIITATGAPVLVDFGAARQEVGGKSRSITRVVTPGYAPIEQYSTRGKQGPWTDIYALGAVAYRAITGKAPPDATERVRGDDMTPATEAARGNYSAAFLTAVDWALAVDEDQRPQDVEAWREALREDARDQQPAAVESQAKATVKPEVKRKVKGKKASGWTRAATVVGVLVLLAMVLDGLRQRSAEVTEVVWEYPQQEAETARDAERQHAVGEKFRDCPNCPEMVVLPWGSFMMGSPASVASWHESPAHWALIARPFAVGVYEVTRGEYARFVAATGHSYGRSCHTYEDGDRVERSDRNWRQPGFPQTDRHPAVCVNWYDAQAYIRWLSSEAGESYRLLSEAEWEYAARANTTTAYHFGENIASSQANNNGGRTVAVGSYPANQFGLHDVHGNVWEWTQDCWNAGYWGAPNDGSAWESGECGRRVLRGGSWYDFPRSLRSVSRTRVPSESRLNILGFRVARALTDDEQVARPATMQNDRAAEAQRRREAQQAAAAVEELKRQQAQAKKELAELEARKQREREQAAAAEQQRKEERRRAAAEEARREREAALAEQLRREEARKAEEQRMASELEELRRQQEQAKKELAELEARKQREREQAAAAEAKRKEEERKLLEAGKALQAVLAGLTPKCKTMSDDDDTPCWMEVDNLSGCYLWNANPLGRDSVEWSGQCKNGMVNGHGEAVFHAFFDDWASITGTGSFVNGKQHGKWVERAHFEVSEGRYMNGKRHGKWIMRSGDDVEESTYVDGRMHGEWVERSADGAVVEGQYMDDQRHGRWIYRLPDGDVLFAECYENDYVIDEDC